MQISALLRNSAERFNQAEEAVCSEWSLAIGSSGICFPVDVSEFNHLVRDKIALLQMESIQPIALHQQTKISA